MLDIFSPKLEEITKEKAGYVLAAKEDKENRHNLKETDEERYEAFLHNLTHPFMEIVRREAKEYAKMGKTFVLRNRIAVLIDDTDSIEYSLYYNNGDPWRQSGEALIGRYLKEKYPDLDIALRGTTCSGLNLLLEAAPNNFKWIRDALAEKAEKATRKKAV